VVGDVAGGLGAGHGGHGVAEGDALFQGYLQPQLTCL
jgi:hypothetical protein